MYMMVEEMPEDGHFVAIWTYNYKVWSAVFNSRDGVWRRYNQEEGELEPIAHPRDHIPSTDNGASDHQYLVIC